MTYFGLEPALRSPLAVALWENGKQRRAKAGNQETEKEESEAPRKPGGSGARE
jgi:hypothetical protein